MCFKVVREQKRKKVNLLFFHFGTQNAKIETRNKEKEDEQKFILRVKK